jgi:hypothetical protein
MREEGLLLCQAITMPEISRDGGYPDGRNDIDALRSGRLSDPRETSCIVPGSLTSGGVETERPPHLVTPLNPLLLGDGALTERRAPSVELNVYQSSADVEEFSGQ